MSKTNSPPGAPGKPANWTTSSKECVGTAHARTSRLWFTMSKGIVTEVYYPTIDRPQIRDMQLLVTDGESFCHSELSDMEEDVQFLDPRALGYLVVNTSHDGRYKLIKEVLCNSDHSCLMMRVRLEGDRELLPRLKVYVVLAPHLEVAGAGNSGEIRNLAGRKLLLAYKAHVSAVLGCDRGFAQTSCGYVGEHDAWHALKNEFKISETFDRVEDGNIWLCGEIPAPSDAPFTLGLAFGDTEQSAAMLLLESFSDSFDDVKKAFIDHWSRQPLPQELIAVSQDGGLLCGVSSRIIRAHEDKTYAGAVVASTSIPWGEIMGDEDIGGYHRVWPRDMSQAAGAWAAMGEYDEARRALMFLMCVQKPDGSFHQTYWIDGRPHWTAIQLDQTAFPILLAWKLWKAGALGTVDPHTMVLSAARYLIDTGPVTQEERWEQNSGYSDSTMATIIAALIAAADMSRGREEHAAARFLEESADYVESHLERWLVTTRGSLLKDVPRHFIWILPVDPQHGVADENPDEAMVKISRQAPGRKIAYPARDIVSAGFLHFVRYGIRRPDDPLVLDSLKVVDSVLKVQTPNGPCWHRYNHDGYGETSDGGPHAKYGIGRAWPLLTGERGHYELQAGHDVSPYIRAMEKFAGKSALLSEQIWDTDDLPDRKLFLGQPTLSARPLVWAHAEYIKLLRSVLDGQVFDFMPVVAQRYLDGRGRKDIELWRHARKTISIRVGQTLRVQENKPFRLRWTLAEWHDAQEKISQEGVPGLHYVDLKITPGQRAPVRFTFYWPETDSWEHADYHVDVEPELAAVTAW